jgi:hypothetical protein
MDIGVNTVPCPPVDEYQQVFLGADTTPIHPDQARIAIGVHTASVAEQAKLVNSLRAELANPPNGVTAAPTGLAVLATTAYENLVNRAYLLNLAPLLVVAAVLFVVYRQPRRALLPLVPTALAAGWAPLLLLLLGRFPGGVGSTLGSFNPLTVVLGALIVALGTEFGVVLLSRFYEERERGHDPAAAAGAALQGVGRAIRVSALTLGAGFGVLALSGLFPNSLPLVADFGLAVVIDLALAVAAVFLVMLPVAVALEQHRPLVLRPVAAAATVAPAVDAAVVARDLAPRAQPLPEREALVVAETEIAPTAPAGSRPRSAAGSAPGSRAKTQRSRTPRKNAAPSQPATASLEHVAGHQSDEQPAMPAAAPSEDSAAPRQPQQTPQPAAGPSMADRLRSLTELRDAGLVTDEEFARKRAALLEQL